MQPSKEHSYFSPLNVGPIKIPDVKGYQELRRIGINLNESTVRRMINGMGLDSVDMGYGMDSIQQGLTTPSITTPLQFLQAWLPGFVFILTGALKIDELVGIATVGDWEDEEVVQGVLEQTSSAVPYSDLTNVPLANWNDAWERRSIVRMEQGMRVGNLEAKRSAKVRIDSAATKRGAATLGLETSRNQIGFYGYNNGLNRTYGFLNDPNLPGYINVAAGASGSTLWSRKTFLEIVGDLLTAIAQLRNQSRDQIDPKKAQIILALPTAVVDRLSTVSDMGVSVQNWLSTNYPGISVVSAPQLNAANGNANVFYLYAISVSDNSTDDGRVFTQPVPAKFQVVGVSQQTKGYEEDYTNATAGVMVKRPYAVVRYSGI